MGFLFDYDEFKRRQQRGLDEYGEDEFDEEYSDEFGADFDEDYDGGIRSDGGFAE